MICLMDLMEKYLGDSCSFIHDLNLHVLVPKMTLNEKTHGSEDNAKILEDSLKEYYHFDFPKYARTVVSDTNNASTKVANYFSKDAE